MAHQSLYLSYRPFQLDDIVGQKPVVATLKQASINNEFAHAYLFSGNHGCGKTSTARILAALVNCENVKNGVLCGECRACKSIKSGTSLDLIEVDGASNRGIENAKGIIDSSKWSPNELKKKVFIIDECHQLSKEAISALLKTLEEPSENVVFILCTTDLHKMLPTILSRCQRFNFSKIASKEIAQRLIDIAKKENIKTEDNACHVLSKMARGSMRDAIGYLDQIGTLAGGKDVSEVAVCKYFGLSDRLGIIKIVESIISGNISLLLDQINDMVMASVDCKQIIYEVSEIFRNIMVIKVQKGNSKIIDLPDHEIEKLKKVSESLKTIHLIKMAHLFSDLDKKITYNINERWITEATFINCVALLRKQ